MIAKSTLEKMYVENKMSLSEISNALNTSIGSIVWWMNKFEIERRDRSQANYEKYNKSGDPFRISNIDTIHKAVLYGLGVGIFWGEGNKVSKTSLRVGNTDPILLKTYIEFLHKICGVKDEKIRFGLQIFNDSNPMSAKEFWIENLKIRPDQFMKTISIIPSQGKGTYKKKNPYGVVTIYVNNIKLVDWMHNQLKNVPR
jgi:hypothetical protein